MLVSGEIRQNAPSLVTNDKRSVLIEIVRLYESFMVSDRAS